MAETEDVIPFADLPPGHDRYLARPLQPDGPLDVTSPTPDYLRWLEGDAPRGLAAEDVLGVAVRLRADHIFHTVCPGGRALTRELAAGVYARAEPWAVREICLLAPLETAAVWCGFETDDPIGDTERAYAEWWGGRMLRSYRAQVRLRRLLGRRRADKDRSMAVLQRAATLWAWYWDVAGIVRWMFARHTDAEVIATAERAIHGPKRGKSRRRGERDVFQAGAKRARDAKKREGGREAVGGRHAHEGIDVSDLRRHPGDPRVEIPGHPGERIATPVCEVLSLWLHSDRDGLLYAGIDGRLRFNSRKVADVVAGALPTTFHTSSVGQDDDGEEVDLIDSAREGPVSRDGPPSAFTALGPADAAMRTLDVQQVRDIIDGLSPALQAAAAYLAGEGTRETLARDFEVSEKQIRTAEKKLPSLLRKALAASA